MALKQYKPNTPGQRGLVLVDKSNLFKGKPVKKLTVGLNKSGGRNNSGKITMWQRGGGHKRRYRIIDFKRTKLDITGTVERIEYDPNRSADLFGSYSILSTVPVISNFVRLKSIIL